MTHTEIVDYITKMIFTLEDTLNPQETKFYIYATREAVEKQNDMALRDIMLRLENIIKEKSSCKN